VKVSHVLIASKCSSYCRVYHSLEFDTDYTSVVSVRQAQLLLVYVKALADKLVSGQFANHTRFIVVHDFHKTSHTAVVVLAGV